MRAASASMAHAAAACTLPREANGSTTMLTLHHHAATRLFVGTLPLLSCAVALVLRDLALAPSNNGLAAACAVALGSCLVAEAVCITLVRRGGVAATARVAKLAAALYLLPAAAVAHAALTAVRRGGAIAKIAAAECTWSAFVAPLGAPFFAQGGAADGGCVDGAARLARRR